MQPLGISYIDDYAQSDNAALYIGNPPLLQLIALIGIGVFLEIFWKVILKLEN